MSVYVRFVSFVIGSVVVVLLLIGLWDEEALFNVEIVGHTSAVWFIGTCIWLFRTRFLCVLFVGQSLVSQS